MKPGMLCLLLVAACSCLADEAPLRRYALTWTCLSPEGCERTEQVMLIDRVDISDHHDICQFWSTRDSAFGQLAELIPADSLPPECSWLYSFSLFGHELEPSKLCRHSGGLALELSIPNRESPTHSRWRVEGQDRGRVEYRSAGGTLRGAP